LVDLDLEGTLDGEGVLHTDVDNDLGFPIGEVFRMLQCFLDGLLHLTPPTLSKRQFFHHLSHSQHVCVRQTDHEEPCVLIETSVEAMSLLELAPLLLQN